MELRLIRHDFTNQLFGCCPSTDIYSYENVLQIKYKLTEIDNVRLYKGMLKLKKKYRNSGYRVIILFVSSEILQVIIGTEEEISKIGNEDFKIEIC